MADPTRLRAVVSGEQPVRGIHCSKRLGDFLTFGVSAGLVSLFAFAVIITSQGEAAQESLPGAARGPPGLVGALVKVPGPSDTTRVVPSENLACAPGKEYADTTILDPATAAAAASNASTLLPPDTICTTAFTLTAVAPLVGAGTTSSPLTLDTTGMTGGELLVFDQSNPGAWSRETVPCSVSVDAALFEGDGSTGSPLSLLTSVAAGSTLRHDGTTWLMDPPLTGGSIVADGAFFTGDGSDATAPNRITLNIPGAVAGDTFTMNGVTAVATPQASVSGTEGRPYYYVETEATLQAKIDAAHAAGGGIVKVMRDIVLTGTIQLKSLVVLEGHYTAGRNKPRFTTTAALPMFTWADSTSGIFWSAGRTPQAHSIEVRELHFDTTGAPAPASLTGVFGLQDSGLRWFDLAVRECEFTLGAAQSAALHVRWAAPGGAVAQTDAQVGLDFKWNEVTFAAANTVGVHVQAYASGTQVHYNKFDASAQAGGSIQAVQLWGELRGSSTANNFFTDCGVDLAGGSAHVVRANYFQGAAGRVQVRMDVPGTTQLSTAHVQHPSAVSIGQNQFEGCASCIEVGPADSMVSASGGYPLGIQVEACLFRDFTGVAVDVQSGQGVGVSHCAFYGASLATTALRIGVTRDVQFSASTGFDVGTLFEDNSGGAYEMGGTLHDLALFRGTRGLVIDSPRWAVSNCAMECTGDCFSLSANTDQCYLRSVRAKGLDGATAVGFRNAGTRNVLYLSAVTGQVVSEVVSTGSNGRESQVGVNNGAATFMRASQAF